MSNQNYQDATGSPSDLQVEGRLQESVREEGRESEITMQVIKHNFGKQFVFNKNSLSFRTYYDLCTSKLLPNCPVHLLLMLLSNTPNLTTHYSLLGLVLKVGVRMISRLEQA
jgi:hypothetical protein